MPGEPLRRNDLKLGESLRVLSVSGSNMSGKSTWLRTIGVNAVLASPGRRSAPIGCGSRRSRSAGRSGFTTRSRRVGRGSTPRSSGSSNWSRCLGKSPPLLFLIDEILHGTNSHDRLQGAEAVVRGLIDRGAIGLFTTHDLALAEVAGRLAPRAENVHFADHLDDKGRLAFDYQMRPGVVRQSNALALMRAVGLDV